MTTSSNAVKLMREMLIGSGGAAEQRNVIAVEIGRRLAGDSGVGTVKPGEVPGAAPINRGEISMFSDVAAIVGDSDDPYMQIAIILAAKMAGNVHLASEAAREGARLGGVTVVYHAVDLEAAKLTGSDDEHVFIVRVVASLLSSRRKWSGGHVAAASPTNDELRNPNNWRGE